MSTANGGPSPSRGDKVFVVRLALQLFLLRLAQVGQHALERPVCVCVCVWGGGGGGGVWVWVWVW